MTIFLLIVAFIGLLLVRTLRFKPIKEKEETLKTHQRDELKIAENLSRMIQFETISSQDVDQMNLDVFQGFQKELERLYPKVHEICERSFHGTTGVLYRWKGRASDAPVVLMSHYDVVPCDRALWSVAPFSGKIDETYVWGRGSLDTKGTLCGILEAAEGLIQNGHTPEQDIYFSFSGDEEISGPSTPAIVDHLLEQGISPHLVLDEGGAIVENVFPGVDKPVAVVGTGEKGYLDVLLKLKGKGGHSSAPPSSSLVGKLAKAVVLIEKKPFKAHLTPPVREMFDTLGRHSTFAYRLIFSNLWLFEPLLIKLFTRSGGEMNALIRTTTAVTKMTGSNAFNVLPPSAEIGVNYRLLPGDTIEGALSYIEETVANSEIEIEKITWREASPLSPTDSRAWSLLKSTINETWAGVIVSPYLMLAASDSRHFCKISKHVLRFSAMPLSKEERGLIHGNDERIKIKTLVDVVNFYENLMLKL